MLFENDFYSEMKRKFLELSIQRADRNESSLTKLCEKVNVKYGFPMGMISDVVTMRVDMSTVLNALLFAIASEVLSKGNIKKYFTSSEIEQFSKYKYQVETVKFPFTFESQMIEIKPEEQYIGRTTVKELMKLRDAQIINYNINTQRTMTLKKGNDFEYYKITLNRKAVEQISELLKNGDFISNTLTFNLSPETDFTYKNGKLTINEVTNFDILDGYHRYIAMSNLYNIDENFDYPMEIRITFLSEENAKQFIYQEDQRTPLSKTDAATMNKNDFGVKVCRFMRNNLGNDIVGQDKIINESVLVKLINLLYFQKETSYERSKLIKLANELVEIINSVSLQVNDLLDTKWTTNFTLAFFGLAKQQNLKGKELYNATKKLVASMNKEEQIGQLTLKRLNTILSIK